MSTVRSSCLCSRHMRVSDHRTGEQIQSGLSGTPHTPICWQKLLLFCELVQGSCHIQRLGWSGGSSWCVALHAALHCRSAHWQPASHSTACSWQSSLSAFSCGTREMWPFCGRLINSRLTSKQLARHCGCCMWRRGDRAADWRDTEGLQGSQGNHGHPFGGPGEDGRNLGHPKGGLTLPVYRCTRGSTSLESFHNHQCLAPAQPQWSQPASSWQQSCTRIRQAKRVHRYKLY